MESFFWISFVLFSVLVTEGRGDNACGENPADVIFVMDSSGSIRSEDFTHQLKFVNDVIDMFDMSPGKTQVGAMSFSNWAYVDFHLDAHRTKPAVMHAIRDIRQIKGDTNTAAALSHMRDIMLTPVHGARLDVPHIAIVLTDGKSNEPGKTAREAQLAQKYGIHVFAIGIGKDAELEELKAIASDPDENYVFQVSDYEALSKIHGVVAIKTCEVTGLPTARPFVPTQPGMIVDEPLGACGDVNMADVIFATSPVASAENTDKALAFYHDVAAGFDIGEDKVRVGMVPKDCQEVPSVSFGEFRENDDVLASLMKMQTSELGTADVLKYMRAHSFSGKNGSRPRAKKFGVLIVDDEDESLKRAYKEADRLRKKKEVQLVVIGVGKNVKESTLKKLTDDPTEQRVFHVEDYDELERLTHRVRNSICPA